MVYELSDVLRDMTEVVRQEVSDTGDKPLTDRAARYIAACLLVGMTNRGWLWSNPLRQNVSLTFESNDAAPTVDQVADFLGEHTTIGRT